VRYDGYTFKTFIFDPTDSTSLSNNQVETIFEDSKGRLWIGTPDGLNCFNKLTGKFTHFHLFPSSDSPIISSSITAICEDSTGNLWIGTSRGLFFLSLSINDLPNSDFSEKTKKGFADSRLIHFSPNPDNPNDPVNNIKSMLIDSYGVFWIGTRRGLGKLVYENAEKKIMSHSTMVSFDTKRVFDFTSKNPNYAAEDSYLVLSEDGNGYLWALSNKSLLRIKRAGDEYNFENFPYETSSFSNISFENKNKEQSSLWFAHNDFVYSDIDLIVFDTSKNRYLKVLFDSGDPSGLHQRATTCVLRTQCGIYFLGTAWGGLYKYDPFSRFSNYHPALQKFWSDRPENLRFVFEDSHSDLWFSAREVYRCNRKTGEIYAILEGKDFPRGWSYKNKILEDHAGQIWLAASGLYRYDPSSKIVTLVYPEQPTKNLAMGLPNVTALFEDDGGNIWAGAVRTKPGTKSRQTMLLKLNADDKKFQEYQLALWSREKPENEQNFIYHIYQSNSGILWLATGFGIVCFDEHLGILKTYQNNPQHINSLSHNQVQSICPDPLFPERYLWVGTASGGLNCFDILNESFTWYTMKDGLPSNHIAAILSDDNGNLWISTNNGISKITLNKENRTITSCKNFNRADGLHDSDFTFYFGHNACKTKQGELIFSGPNGFDIFRPEEIVSNPYPPQLVISDLLVNYLPISTEDKRAALKKPISVAQSITLPHDMNTLTFEMTALSFRASEKNLYAFKMEGYDDNWIENGTDRTAHYTKLPFGNYTFRARAANSDGFWNEEGVSIQIFIKTPWWRTWYAYIFYFIVIFGGIFRIIRFQLTKQKLKTELQMKDMETEKLQELDRMKSGFFANITHEFRTPLTLILGPVQRLLTEKIDPSAAKKDMKMIQRQAFHLLKLINEILDLSKVEFKQMKLKAYEENIVQYLKKLTMSFEATAREKKLSLNFYAEPDLILCYFDSDKIQKVIFNLISNAIKFTRANGEIHISTSICTGKLNPNCLREQGCVQVSVKDTGIGIKKEDLAHVFDRFYQSDTKSDFDNEKESSQTQIGTGIGLALVKELVELHGGYIQVKSEQGKGSTFVFTIPLGKSHLKTDEIVDVPYAISEVEIKEDVSKDSEDSVEEIAAKDFEKDDTIVLIVEDNAEVRTYIKETLQPYYKILEAGDGAVGVEKAVETIPDLVVCDVIMPVKDGYQVCQELKTDQRTSHVPIILLTAKAATEEKIEGLETGADDYLIKPFDPRELLVRVKNLIESRRTLRKRFSAVTVLKPSEITESSVDKVFLEKALSVVEENMSDENFGPQELMRQVSMSRQQLHRKLKALTNQSATQFIRSIRLQRAADLLRQNVGTIAEVAYRVGFNDPIYFNRMFKKQFGKTPTEFLK